MFEAERVRARQICGENALKAYIVEAEEREWRSEIEGGEHVRFLGEKLRKVKESWDNHEAEVCEMWTNTNKALEEMRLTLSGSFVRKFWMCLYGTSWGIVLN